MELFENLPGPLKNIVRKQVISCDELTENGSKCGEKFIYSVNEYLVPERKDELKNVMVNCTKFCLKHLSDLAINGELKLGYETKNERKIIPIKKKLVSIIGLKDGSDKLSLNFEFSIKVPFIHFTFTRDSVDDINNFEKTMIRNERGYPKILSDYYRSRYDVSFDSLVISKPWRKFIIDCFKYEDLDEIKLEINGQIPIGGLKAKIKAKIKNYTLALGNLGDIKIYEANSIGLFGEKSIKR